MDGIIINMGLDANIIKISVPAEQLSLLRGYLRELKTMRESICNGKPLYLATPEEKEAYYQALKDFDFEKFKPLNWDFAEAEEVKHPSTRNSYGHVGYWRVGYGKQGLSNNYVLETLYKAFPELHPNWCGYYGVDWAYARKVVLSCIEELRANEDDERISRLEVFLETIDYVLSQPDPETYFLDWFP